MCRLVGELTRLTAETMTGAIIVALRERLKRKQCRRGAEIDDRLAYALAHVTGKPLLYK